MKRSIFGGILAISTGIVVVIALAIGGYFDGSATSDSSQLSGEHTRSLIGFGASAPPRPRGGIQEFVNHADAIVVATIGKTISDGLEGPYGPDGGQLSDSGHQIRFLRYELNIEDIIVDDGNISDNNVLRIGWVSEANRPQQGENLLLILGVAPDGKSYGVNGDYAVLQFDDSRVVDYTGEPLAYAEDITPEAFMELVDAAVKERVKRAYADWRGTY